MSATTRRLYWLLTALLLAAHGAGAPSALPAVVALNTVQVAHVVWHRRAPTLDVQVRIAYLGFLLLGCIGPLWPIHALLFVGVGVLLVADYCLAARLLALMPWNRQMPLSWPLVRAALLWPPAAGSIAQRLATLDRPGPGA